MSGGAINLQRPSAFSFSGGLDVTSPALAVPATRVIAALNYEPVADGYRRYEGFERTDGRLPSATSFYTLPFSAGAAMIAPGDTITGHTSGATARVLLEPVGVTGTWGAANAAGTLVLIGAAGTFVVGELLYVGGTPHAAAAGILATNVADTLAIHDAWAEAAQDDTRSLIQRVPGSGPVRGTFLFNGTLYAVRDNALATAAAIFMATSTGWAPMGFGAYLAFDTGIVDIQDGDTIVGAISGARALVEKRVLRSGAWDGSAKGYLVLSGQVGAFTAEAILTDGIARANVAGNSAAVTLPAGGRYDFLVKNFYGATNLKRVYGANGVGTGFEYDGGSILVPIETGTPYDAPQRVFDIGNALGFTFPGGSIQISEPGEPTVFNAILGASEIGMGDDITNVVPANDSAVVFFAENKVATLTGRDSASFQFDILTDEAGATAWTAQRVTRTLYLDNRGLRDLQATQAFGNFQVGSVSELFEKFLKTKRDAGARPMLSLRCKSKTQYRLFYDDKSGFTVFMGGKVPAMLPFALPIQATCGVSGELSSGAEGMYVGDDEGFVYKLDSGTNFDGVPVTGFVMLPFNHLGSASISKRLYGCVVEMDAAPQTRIGIRAQFDYADNEHPYADGGDFTVQGGGGIYGASDWGSFYWSTAYAGTAEADLDGDGRNVSIIIQARSAVMEPAHTLQAYTIYWSPRGQVRRVAR